MGVVSTCHAVKRISRAMERGALSPKPWGRAELPVFQAEQRRESPDFIAQAEAQFMIFQTVIACLGTA